MRTVKTPNRLLPYGQEPGKNDTMMTKRWGLMAAGILLFSACSSSEPSGDVTPSPSVTSLAGCYTATVGNDNAYLNINENGTEVSGILEYAFAQKDSSWGLVEGEVSPTALDLNYQFISEGLLSTRTLSLTRDGKKLSGEGFTYEPTSTCGIGQGWSEAAVSNVVADTFHDPETGYYARVKFALEGPANGYAYRCIATVSGSANEKIISWVGFGITDKTTATKRQGMQTNIKPSQKDAVAAAALTCQVRSLN